MEPNAHKVAHRIILSVGLTLQSPNGDTMILKRRTKSLRGNCLDLIMLLPRGVFILLLGFRFSSGNQHVSCLIRSSSESYAKDFEALQSFTQSTFLEILRQIQRLRLQFRNQSSGTVQLDCVKKRHVSNSSTWWVWSVRSQRSLMS
jgi:hypothetical protein